MHKHTLSAFNLSKRRVEEVAQQDIANWGENGSARIAAHTVANATVAVLGGGNALGAATGTVAGGLVSNLTSQFGQAVASGAGLTGVANTIAGNIVSSIAAGAVGYAAGGGAGTAAAATVDRHNRQLHTDEKALAKKMAENSRGKYTQAQIEAQMRLSDLRDMNGSLIESGSPDQINAATTKPTDPGVTWVSVPGTSQIREEQVQPDAVLIAYIQDQQRTLVGDVPYVSKQDYSGVPRYSYSATPLPTAKCGAAQADCVAGLPTTMTEAELMRRRSIFSDGAGQFGIATSLTGRVAQTVGRPEIALFMDALGLIAATAEQIARPGEPNNEKFLTDIAIDKVGDTLSYRAGILGPVFGTVLSEQLKMQRDKILEQSK